MMKMPTLKIHMREDNSKRRKKYIREKGKIVNLITSIEFSANKPKETSQHSKSKSISINYLLSLLSNNLVSSI